MNKKFLSAILFGALMATSAGTFVSCKDYDDDIKDLQTQIDSNKNAIAELQKLVGAGNWVTSVAASGENLVVTMSNGTSTTIAGIKGADGVDGKNAAEWTIGEDGYWYKDGEKTANLAVAQNGEDGKPGATAPSPSISANGMWVVYAWDEAKGEFVATETEIPAAGTSSYVVLKDGAYILNIADETGEFVQISLPATAESFTISGIANKDVNVVLSYGEWNPSTTKKDQELFNKLAAKFPALKEYKKGDFVEQGGKLPLLVSPANVELTKDHSFALVDMRGKDAGATLSNPTKGMPAGLELIDADKDGVLNSRAAESIAVWSLDFAPALNEKGNGYKTASQYMYSLVVSGTKGVIASTPYVYTYKAEEVEKFSISQKDLSMQYAEEIDVFVPTTEGGAYVETPKHMLKDMFILEVKDAAVAEEYGIEVNGSVVTVANMPKGKDTEAIAMILTAIGVNGEVAQDEFNLTITNEIAATGYLADQDITLKATFNKNGTWKNNEQTVLWNIDDLGLTALQLRNFVEADSKTFTIANDDEDAKFTKQENVNVVFLNAKKEILSGTIDYTKVEYMAYTLDASEYVPGDYTVTLTVKDNSTVIYKAEADMVVANPEESLLTLNEENVDAEGVYNAVGTVSGGKVSYNWTNFFKEVEGYNNINYMSLVDLDFEYDDEIGAWLTESENVEGISLNNADIMTWDAATDAYVGDINQTRNFKIQYKMFNNPDNIGEFEFKVKLISNIYAEDPTSVITAKAATAKFDDNTATTTVNESKVDLSGLFSTIYAAGGKKGTAYDLFFVEGGKKTVTTDAVYDYSSPKFAGEYVIKDNDFVSFTAVDYIKLNPGTTATELASNPAKLYIKKAVWVNTIWEKAEFYYYKDGTQKYKTDEEGNVEKDAEGNSIWSYTGTSKIDEDDAVCVELFETYKAKIDFDVTTPESSTTVDKEDSPRASELDKVEFKFVNESDKDYFTSSTLTSTASETSLTLDAKPSDEVDITSLVEGKKVIPMQLIITDVWGMTMTYDFNVTLSL